MASQEDHGLSGEVDDHFSETPSKQIKSHYLGPRIQNELINIIAGAIKGNIITNLRRAKFYSLIVDCTPDVSPKEQMSLVIRFVKMKTLPLSPSSPSNLESLPASSSFSASSITDVEICEHFLTFIQADETTGSSLTNFIIDYLESEKIPIDDPRGQG
jgi:Domain of unknown function (DUF4371)